MYVCMYVVWVINTINEIIKDYKGFCENISVHTIYEEHKNKTKNMGTNKERERYPDKTDTHFRRKSMKIKNWNKNVNSNVMAG